MSSSPPSRVGVAAAAGVSVDALLAMERKIRDTLHNDTSSISAMRCLKLYMESLGQDMRGSTGQVRRLAGV